MEINALSDAVTSVGNVRFNRYETDAARAPDCTIRWRDLIFTCASIAIRAISVILNIELAAHYYNKSEANYFTWTVLCIVLPMCMTSLIYGFMRYYDDAFHKGWTHSLQTGCLVVFLFYPFRYLLSLTYQWKCKRAERAHDREKQEKYYNLSVREESDVALIRIFECFLEVAPQKILQICIVVSQPQQPNALQIVAISLYVCSTALCLTSYHRYVRFAQSDKYNISSIGCILQFGWHMCMTMSRTICITFMALLYPVWTIYACCLHVLILAFITFIMHRPTFPPNLWGNFIFCLCTGAVYLFTYISMKDGPTCRKYSIFYTFCMLENIICIVAFAIYEPQLKLMDNWLLWLWCALALITFAMGIAMMIIYYGRFHPRITARYSNRLANNNNVM